MKKFDCFFASLHPAAGLFYFICVFISFFLSANPVLLGTAFFSALLYQWCMKGIRAAVKALVLVIPLALLIFILNPLFNHNGATALFYLNNRAFTLEALVYGGIMALALADALLWFLIVNDVVNQDKIIYLFGKPFPTAALLLGMIFRVTGDLESELKNVQFAQRSLGIDTGSGSLLTRLKSGVKVFLCVVGNALEHSVDTAAAMKSRGYGLPGHSRRKQYRFHRRDGFLLLVITIMAILISVLFATSVFNYSVFPALGSVPFQKISAAGYFLYCIFLNLPLICQGGEALKWQYFNSKM